MSKTEKIYIGVILALCALVIAISVTGIILRNENRVMHKILELSCQTTYHEQQCMEGVDLFLKNPDLVDKSFDQYVNRYKR